MGVPRRYFIQTGQDDDQVPPVGAVCQRGHGRPLGLRQHRGVGRVPGQVPLLQLLLHGDLPAPVSGSYSNYQRYGQDYGNQYQYQARSGDFGYDFNAVNILQWISMLQEVYEKFDYNDVDCQKLLICEVLRDEYMDASERSLGQKECTEFFQCPYSLKDSVKRNFSGNSL